MSKRDGKTYYISWMMDDGTIVGVLETRKPLKSSLRRGGKIDKDGVYRKYRAECDHPAALERWLRAIYQTTISTRLNVKKLIREQVEDRLDQLSKQITALEQQMDRIERKLDTKNAH